jgi:hypothetical protein
MVGIDIIQSMHDEDDGEESLKNLMSLKDNSKFHQVKLRHLGVEE